MLWRKKENAPATVARREGPTPPSPEKELDSAIDTVCTMLRTLGEKSFDIDGQEASVTRTEFERWAGRVSYGAVRGDGAAPEDSSEGPVRRDWGAVRSFVRDHRTREQQYVVHSIDDLRAAVEVSVAALTNAVREDRATDEVISTQLEKLEAAVIANDAQRIRSEAGRMASLVRDAMAKRREREASQIQALGEHVKSLRSELVEARKQATTDPLTQLYNRAAFDQQIQRVTDLAMLIGNEPYLMVADVDHFKQVNDDFGHVVGDEVLKAVADTLVRHFLRKEDFVARYGGEEFVVLLPDASLIASVSRAERVCEALAKLDLTAFGVNRPITVSVGITWLQQGESIKSWVDRADKALYHAKKSGRDRIAVARGDDLAIVTSAELAAAQQKNARQKR